MILYNVTVNVEDDVHLEWLKWMREIHIPQVMATGYFLEHKICRLLVEEESGTTYTIQYACASMDDYHEYVEKHAAGLQKEHATKFANKFVAFRSLMEVL